MPNPIMYYFSYAHLPLNLQRISKPIAQLAQHMADNLPEGPELSAGLRKLLEAKDCLVRASVAEKDLAKIKPLSVFAVPVEGDLVLYDIEQVIDGRPRSVTVVAVQPTKR